MRVFLFDKSHVFSSGRETKKRIFVQEKMPTCCLFVCSFLFLSGNDAYKSDFA